MTNQPRSAVRSGSLTTRDAATALEEIRLEKTLRTGTLSLRGYGLQSIPSILFDLDHLTKLDLGRNCLAVVPDAIARLAALTELYLNENQLSAVPSGVTELTTLEILDLGLNQITVLPDDFGNLINLEYLRLGSNPLAELSPAIGRLPRLKSLIADHLALTEFPTSITQLHQLRALNLGNNAIASIPIDFTRLTSLRDFTITASNLSRPPIEIVSRGPGAIINYLHAFDRDGDSFQIREAKLLIVGQGAVGKTSLMKRLIHGDAMPTATTTEGIDISKWDITTADGQSFRINFWDFGGQEIYHATHQFFLTKRSLYLFVWDARKEDNILDFDYWLNTIKLLSDSSPVMVILNKIDERIKMIDEESLREKFGNVRSFHKVSALSGVGVGDLRVEIAANIVGLEHIGDVLPKAWIAIRGHLEELNQLYVGYEKYLVICQLYGLDEEKANYLSQYYHDLGVFLHFQDNPVLKQILFLEPEWATNSVYRLADTKEVQLSYGRFSQGQLREIWRDYPRNKHLYLLELMKKFELCFPIPDSGDFVIPELLSTRRPEFSWNDERNLHFQYKYDFMPAGIITRFIVRTHDMNRAGTYWKNGVVLQRENTHALVVSEPLNRRIRIQIRGEDKRGMLAVIRREIDYIHKTLNNPSVAAMVPCVCVECRRSPEPYLHDFDYLRRARARHKWTVECKNGLEDVRIDDILGEIRPPRQRTAATISVYGDYYEGGVSNVITIGDVQIVREYSEELAALAGVDAPQFRTIVRRLARLPPRRVEELQDLVGGLVDDAESGGPLQRIREFALKHRIPILQSLSASALLELVKYLFM